MARIMDRFKVTITNWEKHNSSNKKGHTHFMVSKRLFNDEKISQLTPIEFQLFMYCLTIAADMQSNRFTISAGTVPKYMRINVKSLSKSLLKLMCLQLLTAEKIEVPYIIEENRIEKKRKEVVVEVDKEEPPTTPTPVFENDSLDAFTEYFESTPGYSRLKPPGAVKKIHKHYRTTDNLKTAYNDLREKYEKKKPFTDSADPDLWLKDCHSFIENSLLKEIKLE